VFEIETAQREARAREVRHEVVARNTVGTHRIFRMLFAAQWATAVALACLVTESGDPRRWAVIIAATMIAVPAAFFMHAAPQNALVRHWVALCQIAWTAIAMSLLDGRIEAQSHVFVSLACVALYRDSLVMVTATLVALAVPVLRLATLPAGYVVGEQAWWRIADDTLFVALAALAITWLITRANRTLDQNASDTAELALMREQVGTLVNASQNARDGEIDRAEARERQARENSQGQKLESIGRVATGVAHEINSSMQFVADSVRFVRHSLKDVPRAIASYRALSANALAGKDVAAAARLAHDTDESADLNYFLSNAPDALDRALDGIDRVGSIARSMSEFAHPDARMKADVDLNRAIKHTLNMARNEYKDIAELETHFAQLPLVRCYAGEIGQAVLNIVLNAAHAVADSIAGTDQKGRISVRTRLLDHEVEIAIGDSGDGIAEEDRARIFEPFFTTKKVGRGTGQGLALSRALVVERHQGSIHFETETGKGTTFYIRLPVSDAADLAGTTHKQAAA
jgi:signal transduction histidine kinase